MSLLDELLDHWEEENEAGRTLTPEQLCSAHPELIEQVRWHLKALSAVDDFLNIKSISQSESNNQATSIFIPSESLELVGRYRVEALHASGGLGQVYRAFDTTLGRTVAIKFPKRIGMTSEQSMRFEREAKITGLLEHPGIVPIHALQFDQSSKPCYVMRFIDGTTLDERVKQALPKYHSKNGLSADYYRSDELRRLLQSMVSLGNIVAYANGRGFIHRDIKPANVMLGPFGETLLLDWGLAKQIGNSKSTTTSKSSVTDLGFENLESAESESLTEILMSSPTFTSTGQILGTPAYASPEQLFGLHEKVGVASDGFSLGATLFYVLSGKTPIELLGWDRYLAQARNKSTNFADLLPKYVPLGLRAICEKAMRLSSEDRYESAVDFVNDLDHYLAREPISVVKDTIFARAMRAARKRPALVGASTATLAVVFISLLLASTLIQQKNKELSKGNEQLLQAIAEVQQTNDMALQSLRMMFDDVITTRFGERDVLASEDREYLNNVLDRYLTFAASQQDTERGLAIRAEANLQIGSVLSRLSQNEESAEHLNESIELFKRLLETYPKSDLAFGYRSDLAECYSILSGNQFSNDQFTQAMETARKGLALFDHGRENDSEENRVRIAPLLASFHQVIGEGHNLALRAIDSFNEYEKSRMILEAAIAVAPKNQFNLNLLGRCYRGMGDVLIKIPENERTPSMQIDYAGRAVEVLETLNELHPKVPKYQLGLSWAYYDNSFTIEQEGDYKRAIDEVWKSIGIVEALQERYPLISSYRVGLSNMYLRRARLYLRADNLLAACGDILKLNNSYDLKLDDMTFCIETAQRFLDQSLKIVEYEEFLCNMLHRRAIKFESEKEFDLAAADLQSSFAISKDLMTRMPNRTPIRLTSIYRLLDLSRVHLALGNLKLAKLEYEDANSLALSAKGLSDDEWGEVQSRLEAQRITFPE